MRMRSALPPIRSPACFPRGAVGLFVWLGVAAGIKGARPARHLAGAALYRCRHADWPDTFGIITGTCSCGSANGERTMMTYCARIVAIGLFVADGLTDKMLITFDSNGPKDCLDYSCHWSRACGEEICLFCRATPAAGRIQLPHYGCGRSTAVAI